MPPHPDAYALSLAGRKSSLAHADIVDLAAVRRARVAARNLALVAMLRHATGQLVERAAPRGPRAQALADSAAALDRVSRELALEGMRARAIAAQAARINAAIEAGDIDALCRLKDEVARLAGALPAA
jgi:hypothetical protein